MTITMAEPRVYPSWRTAVAGEVRARLGDKAALYDVVGLAEEVLVIRHQGGASGWQYMARTDLDNAAWWALARQYRRAWAK